MIIKRRKTREIEVGNIKIGGNVPISVQSMTKTDTEDISATIRQIKNMERAGCEIVRVAVKNMPSAKALKEIKNKISIPLVADIHFDYRLAIEAIRNGVDAIRLNPGNICKKREIGIIVKSAKKKKIPIRIGVNSGSLKSNGLFEKRTSSRNKLKDNGSIIALNMVQSAMDYIRVLEGLDFYDIIVSLKSSDILTTIEAYREMASRVNYPFHLGITAAGLPCTGIVKSSIGIGTLLVEGIGDTIRVSLTGNPEEEVRVGKEILMSLSLRKSGPEIISCPTCGRCEINLLKIVKELEEKMTRLVCRQTSYSLFPTCYSSLKIAGTIDNTTHHGNFKR